MKHNRAVQSCLNDICFLGNFRSVCAQFINLCTRQNNIFCLNSQQKRRMISLNPFQIGIKQTKIFATVKTFNTHHPKRVHVYISLFWNVVICTNTYTKIKLGCLNDSYAKISKEREKQFFFTTFVTLETENCSAGIKKEEKKGTNDNRQYGCRKKGYY